MALMSNKLFLLPLLLLITSSSQAGSEFYCCVDSNNRKVCGDSLPRQCYSHSYQVFDSSGNFSREVSPPLTPEEKQAQVAEKQRRKRQEETDREQQRRDQALLDTYATPQDIDFSQRKAENDVNIAIAATQDSVNIAMAKRQKLLNEAEFYRKTTLPPELAKNLRAIEHQIKLDQELLELKKRDFETIRNKYDADRQRYQQLTGRRSSGSSGTSIGR
jgi:hypothetical protein